LDIVYVLSLMQVAFLLLAALGEVVLMGGNPAYLAVPVIKSTLLIVFATRALRRRRWALRGLVVLAWITLVGVVLQLLVGLFPAADFTVNLVGLMTNVALPIAVIWICRPYLRAIKQARRADRAAQRAARVLPVPQDPYGGPTVPMGPSHAMPVMYGAPAAYGSAGYGSPVPPGTPGTPVVYPPVVHGRPIEQEQR
jgi:hypothetical protein